MTHVTYLAVLVGCLAATVPLDFHYRSRVLARPGRLALTLTPLVLAFSGWDIYAISRHQWRFNATYVTGLTLPGRLPIEEVLFFLIIPFAAICTFEAVRRRGYSTPVIDQDSPAFRGTRR